MEVLYIIIVYEMSHNIIYVTDIYDLPCQVTQLLYKVCPFQFYKFYAQLYTILND